jgi:hypothetical protein
MIHGGKHPIKRGRRELMDSPSGERLTCGGKERVADNEWMVRKRRLRRPRGEVNG